MKNLLLRLTLSMLVVVSFTNCSELDDLYQDPDGFSKAQADAAGVSIMAGYFTSQLTQGFFLRGDYGSHYHQLRSGSRIMGAGVELYYNIAEYGLAYSLRDVENDWGSNAFNRGNFNRINSAWTKQYLWAQKEFNKIPEGEASASDELYMKLLQFLKAVAYQRTTDLYDKVPYFETGTAGALDGDKASWIGQEEIYPIILQEAKEIEEYLAGLELEASVQGTFNQQDVIFGGSIMQWRKYINSSRLRWAMNVSEVLPGTTSTVLAELNGKPLFDSTEDVAGLTDTAIVDPTRLQRELGITRAFRERSDECRIPQRYLDNMGLQLTEESAVVNGETLYYYSGDNSADGLEDGTVDPRIPYLFSKDILGRYVGAYTSWDDGTDPNSHFSKAMRTYYINHPIMTDISVTEITFGNPGLEMKITLNAEAAADLSIREAFLLKAFRTYVAQYSDIGWTIGRDKNMIAEFNTRPQFNFDIRYPTLTSVETELSLAEAAVRGLGSGNATDHYKRAIEMSCDYWYDKNASNSYTQSSVPSFPSNMDASRIDRDRATKQYSAATYAENAAQAFSAMTDQEKVKAIFDQLQLHYNLFNFEVPYAAARRLIKYLGDNPGSPFEVFEWKERFLYNPNIQATDPAAWALVSQFNDPNIPLWFTGRTTKWKNVLE